MPKQVAEYYGSPVYRKVNEDGRISCEHCYDLEGYVWYSTGTGWCPDCAASSGWIDDDQYDADCAENARRRKEALKEEIGGFTGVNVYRVAHPNGRFASASRYTRVGAIFSGSGPLKNHLVSLSAQNHESNNCDVVEYELVEKRRCSVEAYKENEGFPEDS